MIKSFIKNNDIECYFETNLKKYNTYRLNTTCKYLIFPNSKNQLIKLMKFIKENNYKYLILGNGSNIIFKNQYYDGIIIKLDKLNKINITNNMVDVEAGYPLPKLSLETANNNLSGLEFAAGIPGHIGASVAMNAGAYNASLSQVVEEVEVLTKENNIITMKKEDLKFDYRSSIFKQNKDYIILSCKLKLEFNEKENILELINTRRKRRMETQPLNFPSAGSVFRNPSNKSAGELIEKCGLKNTQIGGAMISEKHANFIINYNNATGKNIIDLIELAQKEVLEKYHIELILEQIIVD